MKSVTHLLDEYKLLTIPSYKGKVFSSLTGAPFFSPPAFGSVQLFSVANLVRTCFS